MSGVPDMPTSIYGVSVLVEVLDEIRRHSVVREPTAEDPRRIAVPNPLASWSPAKQKKFKRMERLLSRANRGAGAKP
jgi:hypothetical protein